MSLSGDHASMAKRVTELEGTLKTQSADTKNSLDVAKQREDAKLQAEKTEIERLLALADTLGRKYFIAYNFYVQSIV